MSTGYIILKANKIPKVHFWRTLELMEVRHIPPRLTMDIEVRNDMSPTENYTNKWFPETDSSYEAYMLIVYSIECFKLIDFLRDKISASQVLQNHSRWLKKKVSLLGPKIRGELRQNINTGNGGDTGVRPEGKDQRVDIYHQLHGLPLGVLSAYIDTEVRALNSARSDLSYQRSNGAHRASTKAQDFVREFDRFFESILRGRKYSHVS